MRDYRKINKDLGKWAPKACLYSLCHHKDHIALNHNSGSGPQFIYPEIKKKITEQQQKQNFSLYEATLALHYSHGLCYYSTKLCVSKKKYHEAISFSIRTISRYRLCSWHGLGLRNQI